MTTRIPVYFNTTTQTFEGISPSTDGIALHDLSAGTIAMQGPDARVTGLARGLAVGQALTWGQINAALVNLAMTGEIHMLGNPIRGLPSPSEPDQPVTRAYLDAALALGLVENVVANEAVTSGSGLVWGGASDQALPARADDLSRVYIAGVAETSASAGSVVRLVRRGRARNVLTSATVGTRYYLGSTGGLITDLNLLGETDWVVLVGIARNATDLDVLPQVLCRR